MPYGVVRCHLGTLPAIPSDVEEERRNGSGSRPCSERWLVSVNQVQEQPVVQSEGTPEHDGVVAKAHLLLDCRVNKTFPTMPPDTQPTVVVVECKARFVSEEDLRRQAWSYCWAMGTEVHSMHAVPDGLPANVHVSGRPQLSPVSAKRGSSNP